MKKPKEKSFRQMMEDGKAKCRQDAIELKKQRDASQLALDLYTARSPWRSPWGV